MTDDPKRVAVVGGNLSILAGMAGILAAFPTPAISPSALFGCLPTFRGPSSEVEKGPPKLNGKRLERLKKQCGGNFGAERGKR